MLIRPIIDDQELDAVHRLIHDAYVEQGYIEPRPDGRLRHYADIEAAPENMVLVAIDGGAIVGTVSVTLDGPAGLHVDHDFRALCDDVRAEGLPVGAVWRIVTEPGHRASRALVIELIRGTIAVFQRVGVATSLCTFAPRHERAYERLLGFRTIGRAAGIDGEVSTPAVLMRIAVTEAARRLPPHDNPAIDTLVAERMRLLAMVRRVAA